MTANQQNAKTPDRVLNTASPVEAKWLPPWLTAETVIDLLEDQADCDALAAAINADYRPRTNFELELVARSRCFGVFVEQWQLKAEC